LKGKNGKKGSVAEASFLPLKGLSAKKKSFALRVSWDFAEFRYWARMGCKNLWNGVAEHALPP